jgi:hypothetical protein
MKTQLLLVAGAVLISSVAGFVAGMKSRPLSGPALCIQRCGNLAQENAPCVAWT